MSPVEQDLPTFESFTIQWYNGEFRAPIDRLKVWKTCHGLSSKWINEITIYPIGPPKKLEDGTWLYETTTAYYCVKPVFELPRGYYTLPMHYGHYKLISTLKNQKEIEGKKIHWFG